MHYQRWSKYGTTKLPKKLSIEERFWSKVNKQTSNGCWEWTAAIRSDGYGVMTIRYSSGKYTWRTHRFSWTINNGPIPNELCVLHHCDNRACVRPSHLFLGTKKDNAMDMVSKNRHAFAIDSHALDAAREKLHLHPELRPSGEDHWKARLNKKDIIEIRRLHAHGMDQSEIGHQFGVLQSHIRQIVHHKSWSHIK